MSNPMNPAQAVADAIDADELVELVQNAVQIPSVTPDEGDFGRWVSRQLDVGGWEATQCSEFEPGRTNVYATAGSGRGRSLVLAGHLDTVHADDWIEYWAGTERSDPYSAPIIDGEIWGDRAVVLYQGRKTAEVEVANSTKDDLVAYITGARSSL